MRGCATAGGDLIDAQYAKPLPWIGLYIAAASLLCAAAMALDTYGGFRRRRLWFPSRLFSLNATTLTVLGVAAKISMDLNTAMPHAADQLAKISGTALLCTAMGNLMPSLGAMNDSEILPNVLALIILVVNAVVNVCIQMGTGVIYVFLPELAVMVVLMMVLLIFVSSALPVPTTKEELGVAAKLPMDLNSAMPHATDQLTKLSGMVLLCTAMGNLMPSLGSMSESEILSNVLALAILVITAVVNVCIQMGTGVIYAFLPEHAVVMVLMMVLLLIFVSSALPVPTTKEELEKIYDRKYGEVSYDPAADDALPGLQMCVKKYWLMAHTGSPQYVLGRSATCTASGAFCLLAAAVFAQAFLRGLFWKSSLRLCNGTSDYGWSSRVVVFTQAAGILLGTIAPACRWFTGFSFRSPEGNGWNWRDEFRVEKHWVKRLEDWKAAPVTFLAGGGRRRQRWRRTAHQLQGGVMSSLIWLQKGVVTGSKLFRLVSVLPLSLVDRGGLLRNVSSLQQENTELKEYVLHLEGEEDLVRLITRSERRDTDKWIDKGRRRAPATMVELIKKHSNYREGFKEVGAFDNKVTPHLVPVEPPNCWALPLVTLAGVAVALPGIDQKWVESLLCGVGEGLRYVRLIEKYLDEKGLVNMREAADLIWQEVELDDRWLDQDLHTVAPGDDRTGRKALEKLQEIAEDRVQRFWNKINQDTEANDKENSLEWPEEMLAAHCMDRVCRTILAEYDCKHQADDQRLFSWLQSVIADILGACLTNLSVVVSMECFCSKVEVREKRVREAAHILGETEAVLVLLGQPEVARLLPEKRQYIDDWRKEGESGSSNLPSTPANMVSSSSPSDE